MNNLNRLVIDRTANIILKTLVWNNTIIPKWRDKECINIIQ